MANHLSSPAIILSHILQNMKVSKSTLDTLFAIETKLKNLETKSLSLQPQENKSFKQEHLKLSQEVRKALKALAERITPVEQIHKTMVSSNTRLKADVEGLKKALEEMERKLKQQEAQVVEIMLGLLTT